VNVDDLDIRPLTDEEVAELGITPVGSVEELEALVASGDLVPLDAA